jgi:succinoglycan biosynthesis transport protein ExoP
LRFPKNMPVLAVAARPLQQALPAQALSMPQDYANPGLSLMQLWAIFWAYRKLILAIAVAITLASGIFAKLMAKTYSSTATLMVNYESNDPMAARGMQTGPVGTYISTEMQLMASSEVLLPVVDKLNLVANKNYTAGYHGDGSGLRDWIKDALIKDLEIEQGKLGSQLILITASARDGILSAEIANAVADTYLEQQKQRVYGPASERAKNYSQELAELKHKVSVAQDQVTAFRQRTGVTDASAQANNVDAELLTTLEQRYQEAQNQRRAAEVAAAANAASSSSVMGSAVIQGLKTQLNDQAKQLAQMEATMGTAHPKVIELQNQMAATRRSLAAEVQTYSSNSASDLSSARLLEQKLAAAVEEQRTKVLAVRKLQDEGTKYVLELESAQSVYKRALDGYDQIMFASGEHYANVNFVSRAVPAIKAAKPNKPKLVIMGALAGLFFGLLGPFGYELILNRRVRCRDDFERGFGVPVLSEFDSFEAAAGHV